MKSKTTPRFQLLLQNLPVNVRRLAIARYRLWADDPFAPAFHFKEIYPPVWSVRINQNYRALAKRQQNLLVWFWIGPHDEYDRLLRGLTTQQLRMVRHVRHTDRQI